MVSIREIANQTGFRGTPNHKIAEPAKVGTLPVIDNSVPTKAAVRTSVDCYVSGQYVQRNGKVMEVTQRYTVFVSYTKETQQQTMSEVRTRIVADFENKYGTTFNVTNIFVPFLQVPVQDLPGQPGQAQPLEFYRGSGLFREMTRFEKMRFEVKTERFKAETNIENIKERYGYRR